MKKKKRMNHKDTHPNWANLSDYEKARVRERNYAERDRLRSIERWKQWLKERPEDAEEIKYKIWKLENPDKAPGFTEDFNIRISMIFKKYFDDGGTLEGFSEVMARLNERS
tara:strand:+ start:1585 stop:1917 length:333 start_codon:yes stop_codon:yes gene_type:complete